MRFFYFTKDQELEEKAMAVIKTDKGIFMINVTDGSHEDMAAKYERDMREILDDPELSGNPETGEIEEENSDTMRGTISYDDFLARLRQDILSHEGYDNDEVVFWPEGYTSEDPMQQADIVDANRRYRDSDSATLLFDMLMLKKKAVENGISFAQRIDTRALYRICCESGYDEALYKVKEHGQQLNEASGNGDRLEARKEGKYEALRGQLILRPLNYYAHAQELSHHVYRRAGDVALVLYQVLGDVNGNLLTSKIHKEELDRWGMTGQEEKVWKEALENTARLYPPCVFDLSRKKEVDFLKGTFKKQDILWMGRHVILSTFRQVNGAAALFYPGVVEKMMQVLGGSFLAVFMNTSDVMVFEPERGSSYARSAIRTAKKSTDFGEPLSYKCYICDEDGIRVKEM